MSILDAFSEYFRDVDVVPKKTTFEPGIGYTDGAEEAIRTRMAVMPARAADLKSYPDGTNISDPMAFYQIAMGEYPVVHIGDSILLGDGREFRVVSQIDYSQTEGITIHFGTRIKP